MNQEVIEMLESVEQDLDDVIEMLRELEESDNPPDNLHALWLSTRNSLRTVRKVISMLK